MLRSTARKVMWVGRATVFLVGLAVILALVFGAASMAFAKDGDPWLLGNPNVATAITSLGGKLGVNGPMVRITNNNSGTNDTALDLRVQDGESPMRVNSDRRVTNLNADAVDGKDFNAFDAERVITGNGPLPKQGTYTSKGGTLIILASGSGYRDTTTHGWMGMTIRVDGSNVGEAILYSDETISHKAFVADYIVVSGLPAGEHTIRLEENDSFSCGTADERDFHACTATDSSDYFKVTVLEIPAS